MRRKPKQDANQIYKPPGVIDDYYNFCQATYGASIPASCQIQLCESFNFNNNLFGNYRIIVGETHDGLVVGIEGTSELLNWVLNTMVLPGKDFYESWPRGAPPTDFLASMMVFEKIFSTIQAKLTTIQQRYPNKPIVGFVGHSAGATLAEMLRTRYYDARASYAVLFNGYKTANQTNVLNLRTTSDPLSMFVSPVLDYSTVAEGGHSLDDFQSLCGKSWEEVQDIAKVRKPKALISQPSPHWMSLVGVNIVLNAPNLFKNCFDQLRGKCKKSATGNFFGKKYKYTIKGSGNTGKVKFTVNFEGGGHHTHYFQLTGNTKKLSFSSNNFLDNPENQALIFKNLESAIAKESGFSVDELKQLDSNIKAFNKQIEQFSGCQDFASLARVAHDFSDKYRFFSELSSMGNKIALVAEQRSHDFQVVQSSDLHQLKRLKKNSKYAHLVDEIDRRIDQVVTESIEQAVKHNQFDSAFAQVKNYCSSDRQHDVLNHLKAKELQSIFALNKERQFDQSRQLIASATRRYVKDATPGNAETLETMDFLFSQLSVALDDHPSKEKIYLEEINALKVLTDNSDLHGLLFFNEATLTNKQETWESVFAHLSKTDNLRLMNRLQISYDRLTAMAFNEINQYAQFYLPEMEQPLDKQRERTMAVLEAYERAKAEYQDQPLPEGLAQEIKKAQEDLQKVECKQAFSDAKDILLKAKNAQLGVDIVVDVMIQVCKTRKNDAKVCAQQVKKLEHLRGMLSHTLMGVEESIRQKRLLDHPESYQLQYMALRAITSGVELVLDSADAKSKWVKRTRQANTVLIKGLDAYSLFELCGNVANAVKGNAAHSTIPSLVLSVLSRTPGLSTWLLDAPKPGCPVPRSTNPAYVFTGQLVKELSGSAVNRYSSVHGATLASNVLRLVSGTAWLAPFFGVSSAALTAAPWVIVGYYSIKTVSRLPQMLTAREVANIARELNIALDLDDEAPEKYREKFFQAWIDHLWASRRLKRKAFEDNHLYRAISQYTKESPQKLRQKALKHMRSHKIEFAEYFVHSESSQMDTGPDAVANLPHDDVHIIKALGQVLDRPIIVININLHLLESEKNKPITRLGDLRKPIVILLNQLTRCYEGVLMWGEPHFQGNYEKYVIPREQPDKLPSLFAAERKSRKRGVQCKREASDLVAQYEAQHQDSGDDDSAMRHHSKRQRTKNIASAVKACVQKVQQLDPVSKEQLKLRYRLWSQQQKQEAAADNRSNQCYNRK